MQSGSALPGKEVPQGVVVVLIKGGVYERVEEGVGVSQPQEDALPDGRDVAGAQRDDELGDEEGNPAKYEHADQNADHQSRLLLLLLAPRVPVRLEGHGGVAHGEHHLGLLCFILHLRESQSADKSVISFINNMTNMVRIIVKKAIAEATQQKMDYRRLGGIIRWINKPKLIPLFYTHTQTSDTKHKARAVS